MNIIHVIVKLRDQSVYFNGENYPCYAIGWKKDDDIHLWNGEKLSVDDVDHWKAI